MPNFAQAHAQVWAWILNNEASFGFARSMRDNVERFGQLTPGQLSACQRMAANARKPKARVDTSALMAAFDKAKQAGVKKPKMRFTSFIAKLAPPEGKNPGAVYLTRRSDKTYLGKIDAGGAYHQSSDCPPEMAIDIVATMQDPLAQAVAYGQRTGECSICGRELTAGESIDRGIGPICAERFGL